MEEEQRQRQLQQAEASIAVPSGNVGLESTPEGQEASFDARHAANQADAQVPAPSTQGQQYPTEAQLQNQSQPQSQYGYYQENQYHQSGYYQQTPYHGPQQSHNPAYYHPHGQAHQQTHHYQNPYQHHQPANGPHHQPHYQGHHQYQPRRSGYYTSNAGGYPPAVGYYGAPVAASQIYQQPSYQQYHPSQSYYRPTSGPSKPLATTEPSSTSVPSAPTLAGPAASTVVSNISSLSISPIPLVRQSKKIQIVDPNTMKEVELTDIPKVKAPSPETSSVAPTPTTTAKISPAGPAKLEITQPVRKPVVLVDPTSNKEVDLSTLAASTQKLANILDEMDEDGLFDSSDEGDSVRDEDEDSLSHSDIGERESDEEVGEEESEEEDYSSLDFPVILTRNIKVNYPDGAVSFTFPKESEPLRYTTEFLLQFAPHCRGEAKDIASVAFPKEVPIRERSERRSQRTTGNTGRSSHQERHHRSGGGKHRHHHTYNPEDTVLTNRAADAWKRANAMVMDEDLAMLREVKMLLNKLTEEKFEIITQQILQIGVLKTGMTTGVIDMLFDKAVEEPRYAPLYARLCHRIWLFEIEALKRELPADQHADIGKKSVFRKSLVTKCQVEYDTKRAYSKQRLEKLMAKQLNNAQERPTPKEGTLPQSPQECAGPAAKETPKYTGELTEEDYAMIKLKRRVLGNMRFIGELFMVGLIPGKIMHSVIQELLADVVNPEEEEVESVCRLLPTVGAALDKPDMVHIWSKYVERLKTLSGNTKLPSRVRFMVLDVLELRDNGWNKVAPVASSSASTAGRPPRNDMTSGRRDSSGPTSRPGRDSIRYSTSKSQDVRYERSTPSPRPTTLEELQAPVRIQNRHAAQGSTPRAMATGPSNAADAEEIPRPASRASQGSLNRYQALEEEEESSAMSPSPGQDPRVEEKLLGKLTSTFDESMTQKNYEDVTLILADIPASARALALQHLLLHVMDKGKKAVEMLANILLPEYIFQKGPLSPVESLSALQSTLEQLDDLVVDIPNAPEYAGSLAASFIRAKLLTLHSLVSELLQGVLARSPSTVAKVILFTLHALPDLTEVEEREMAKNITDNLPALKDSLIGLKSLTDRLGMKNLLDSDA